MSCTASLLATLALCGLATATPSHGLCLNPKTRESGYHLPLAEEARRSAGIVVGKVTEARALQEDRDDPAGVTAHLYTVRILRPLKGPRLSRILLKVTNESGRYPMEIGETHLLFFQGDVGAAWVNSCGNSTVLPEGSDVLAEVERHLQRGKADAL